MFGGKKKTEVRPRDGHIEHVQIFRVYQVSLKNGVDIWTFVRKTCEFA